MMPRPIMKHKSCIRFLFAMYGSKMTFHTHQCFTDGDGLVNVP